MASAPATLNTLPSDSKIPREKHWYDGLKPDFALKSMADYYAMMRFVGYVYAATYSGAARGLEARNPDWKSPSGSGDWLWDKGPTGNFWHAKKIINVLETVTFLGVTAFSFFKDRKEFVQDFAQTVACEKNMDPSKVDMSSISQSDNPIIKSVINRHSWSTIMRTVSDIAFSLNLKVGLVAKGLDITYERAAFVENVAYDILKKTIGEVQNYKLGEYERDFAKKELMRAVQRSLIDDHTAEPLSNAEIMKNSAVFDHLTDGIIKNKLGLKEAVYVLGQVIKQPNNPEKTIDDLNKIEAMGMDAFTRAKIGGHAQTMQKRSFMDFAKQNTGLANGLG